MGYTLCAFIAHKEVLSQIDDEFQHAVVVALPQDMSMLLNTDEFHDEIGIKFKSEEQDRPYKQFWKLSQPLVAFAKQLSANGKVGYVEAEFFGGVGTQASIIWKHGKIKRAPTQIEARPGKPPLHQRPINQALRQLGVSRGTHIDEFDALGLGRHRYVSGWLVERDADDRQSR